MGLYGAYSAGDGAGHWAYIYDSVGVRREQQPQLARFARGMLLAKAALFLIGIIFFSVMMAAMQPLLNELEDWLSYYGDEYGYYDNFDDSYNYNFGDDYNAGDNGDLFGDDWPDFYGEEAPAANAA